MKCHYTTDKIAGRVLIPGCEAVAHSYDIELCTCRNHPTFAQFEKEIYNQTIKEKDQLISELEKENESLNRIITKLIKNGHKREIP